MTCSRSRDSGERHIVRLICGLLCVIVCAPGASPRAEGESAGSITGRVMTASYDQLDGVPGVTLHLERAELELASRATTQDHGRYAFTGLEPGNYTIKVDNPQYESYAATIELEDGREVEHDVALTARFKESITVTATRTARPTEQVPAAVSVIGPDTISKTPMTNIKEAIAGTPGTLIESKNQGYDARLIIRGAGLKARYAIREVMLLLNGIPITDPDSLTRLDFVDTHLVDRIEVVRGPNSTLWGINSTGGAVNVVTKSPFDGQGANARLDVGNYGARNLQLGYTGDIADKDLFNLNFCRRQSTNDWREWNEFDTTQFTLQT